MARPSQRRDPLAQSQTQPATMVVEQVRVELLYDYSRLPAPQRRLAEEAARTIKPRLRRAAADIFVIGAALNGVKAQLEHGQFGDWLAVEFGLSRRMAQHFMNVATRLQAKSEKFSHLPPSTLYLLAAPTTPDEAIRVVEERLDAGDRPQLARVARIVELSKQAQRTPSSPAPAPAAPLSATQAGTLAREVQAAMALVLEDALAQALARLDSIPGDKQPGELWGKLFHNREYSRVRNEVAALLRQVQARRAG
ncbi:MAG: hypothetical protein DCC57_21550 [Chloroflexi bacterium]|nr:MAG: hypothetical protein DCC57_21550 [Chloroflexota bacterium]